MARSRRIFNCFLKQIQRNQKDLSQGNQEHFPFTFNKDLIRNYKRNRPRKFQALYLFTFNKDLLKKCNGFAPGELQKHIPSLVNEVSIRKLEGPGPGISRKKSVDGLYFITT